jgi:myo-inositol-1(or 4)-monophosphatase
MENKSKELEVAIQAALEAGKILEKYFETEILKEFKEDKSPVTIADRESEDIIKKIINKSFPEHAFLGEETGRTEHKSEYVWHVDPIDGTRNFANGIPLFVVSIALAFKQKLIVGVIYNPITKSLFYAEEGKGAYLNNKRIFVSKDDESQGMMTVSTNKKPLDQKLYRALLHDIPGGRVVRSVRDIGCAALDLAYVARGGFEVNVQLGLSTYDFAAGVLIAQEAGAKITILDGSKWEFPNNYFIASNGIFHDKIVEEIKKQKIKLKYD